MRIYGQVQSGSIVRVEAQEILRAQFISTLRDGDLVSEDIKQFRPPKSHEQMGYYFSVILPLIRSELIDRGFDVMGVPVTIDQTDAIIKHYCARIEGRQIVLKRNMNLDDASKFIDNVIRWAAITLNIAIPEPKK